MSNLLSVKAPLKIALLEDHPLYREGLRTLIQKSFPTVTFDYIGADFLAAQDAVQKQSLDLAIVDLHLGDNRTPSEIVSLFSSKGIRVLVISALNNFESVKSAFSVGASGFISKESSNDEMVRAITAIINGKEWISPTLSVALNKSISPIEELSPQEKKAVILYASGLKLEAVARRMAVAPSTAKQYIDRAKQKFKAGGFAVRTKTEMYKYLRNEGMID